jgi:hypothetical protein
MRRWQSSILLALFLCPLAGCAAGDGFYTTGALAP